MKPKNRNMNKSAKEVFFESQISKNKIFKAQKKEINVNTMSMFSYQGTNPIDLLQAKLNNAGIKVLSALEKEKLIGSNRINEFENTTKQMVKNADFNFNIGFAGEQSAGKSMVINSLLQYPLMPTCNLTTTANVVQLKYGEKIRVTAIDDDTNEQVFDLDCTKATPEQFTKLKEYAVLAMQTLIVENIQYFTDIDVMRDGMKMTVADLNDMEADDPKQIALLSLILLSVYIGQNDINFSPEKKDLMTRRDSYLRYFGIPKDTYNISVFVDWNNEYLKNGLIITDLPGLGAAAKEREIGGRIIKSHDEITCEAIGKTDAMVFLAEPTVKNVGFMAVKKMIEALAEKKSVDKEMRILPLLNKVDRLHDAQLETSKAKFATMLSENGLNTDKNDIMLYSAIFGEYMYKDVPKKRLLYMAENERNVRRYGIETVYQDLKEDYEKSHIEELKNFFRTVYVEKAKYIIALDTEKMLKQFVEIIISDFKLLDEAYTGKANKRDIIIKNITKEIEKVLENEVASWLKKLTHEAEYLENKNESVQKEIKHIAQMYINIFSTAIAIYKKKILEILPKFELYGLGNKARIDKYGTKNYNLYFDELCPELQSMEIDTSDINQAYASILGSVYDSIFNYYDVAVSSLDIFKNDVKEAINASVLELEKKETDDISQEYRRFADITVKKIDEEIKLVKVTSDILKKEVDEIGKEVASSLIKANETIVSEFSDGITCSVKSKIVPGMWFETREFLTIYGENGIKKIIENLTLIESEKRNIQENINAVCADVITNNINGWIDKAYEITEIYGKIYDETRNMLREINDTLEKPIEVLGGEIDGIRVKIKKLETILLTFNTEIKESYNEAAKYMHNSKHLVN